MAFFVQQGHYSNLAGDPPAVVRVAPRPAIGFLDNSVFAPLAAERPIAAGLVSLSWMEHRAFCFRLLIPRRFAAFTPDDPDGVDTRQRVAQALNRFRPAGVEVRVEFADDRWVLGQGVLLEGASENIIDQLRSGTALWAGSQT
jgi:hypothetical protein